MKIKVIVFGAAGRMGSRIVSLAVESSHFDIVGAVETANHPEIGKDIGLLAMSEPVGIILQDKPPKSAADVVIDFSLPEVMGMVIDYCLEYKIALVSGTTGLSEKQREKIIAASEKIPIVYATNMSVGMNVLFSLAGKVASMLGATPSEARKSTRLQDSITSSSLPSTTQARPLRTPPYWPL